MKRRTHRIAILGCLLVLAGLVALGVSYFGRFPGDLDLPPGSIPTEGELQGPAVPPEYRVERWEGFFPSRSTLQEVLFQKGFTSQDIHELITDTREVYDLNKVAAGNRFALERFGDGRFKRFEYYIDDEQYLIVGFHTDRYVGTLVRRELNTTVERIYGEITANLWSTLIGWGESGQLTMNILELMQWDIDFTAIQPKDSFKLIFEKKYHEDEFVKYGDLLAMEFRHGGKSFHAFLFKDPISGKTRHYDVYGKNVKKAFLKVPLKADFRVSSGFSYSRLHPVLRRRLPHYGVDYAAPRGTPVYASASGRIVFAGRKGGNGKMVKIRHPNGFSTYYLHLSKIHVRTGKSVAQGDRIGSVGSTGIATGPHLDYRIQRRDGTFINPRKFVSMPADKGVDPKYMEQFLAVRDAFLRQLELIPERSPAGERISVAG